MHYSVILPSQCNYFHCRVPLLLKLMDLKDGHGIQKRFVISLLLMTFSMGISVLLLCHICMQSIFVIFFLPDLDII